uniref:Uncharacterized protein n=1 Tax=Rhizophora mucronata TaxID=61149 RepID=A0A2P2QHP1_RHIMU
MYICWEEKVMHVIVMADQCILLILSIGITSTALYSYTHYLHVVKMRAL